MAASVPENSSTALPPEDVFVRFLVGGEAIDVALQTLHACKPNPGASTLLTALVEDPFWRGGGSIPKTQDLCCDSESKRRLLGPFQLDRSPVLFRAVVHFLRYRNWRFSCSASTTAASLEQPQLLAVTLDDVLDEFTYYGYEVPPSSVTLAWRRRRRAAACWLAQLRGVPELHQRLVDVVLQAFETDQPVVILPSASQLEADICLPSARVKLAALLNRPIRDPDSDALSRLRPDQLRSHKAVYVTAPASLFASPAVSSMPPTATPPGNLNTPPSPRSASGGHHHTPQPTRRLLPQAAAPSSAARAADNSSGGGESAKLFVNDDAVFSCLTSTGLNVDALLHHIAETYAHGSAVCVRRFALEATVPQFTIATDPSLRGDPSSGFDYALTLRQLIVTPSSSDADQRGSPIVEPSRPPAHKPAVGPKVAAFEILPLVL